jgi:hypothetical protein
VAFRYLLLSPVSIGDDYSPEAKRSLNAMLQTPCAILPKKKRQRGRFVAVVLSGFQATTGGTWRVTYVITKLGHYPLCGASRRSFACYCYVLLLRIIDP